MFYVPGQIFFAVSDFQSFSAFFSSAGYPVFRKFSKSSDNFHLAFLRIQNDIHLFNYNNTQGKGIFYIWAKKNLNLCSVISTSENP